VHAVRVQRYGGLDIVVDDERDSGLARDGHDGPASLDEIERAESFDAQLDDRRASLCGDPSGLLVFDDAVQLHASPMFRRWSSDSGVSAYNAS
jgi:hypothetical protein